MKVQIPASSLMYHMSYFGAYLPQKWGKRRTPPNYLLTGVYKFPIY